MKFLEWLGNTALGTATKIGIAASLVYMIDNVGLFEMPLVLQVAFVGFIPSVINWLNPADPRYGKGSKDVVSG